MHIPHRRICIGVFATIFVFFLIVRSTRAQTSGKVDLVAPTTAFVNVNVVPMDRDAVLPRQTVIVQQGYIVVVGPTASTKVPAGFNVIDGRGRYLMPGLADMHVHLEGRKNFGDAPLFLAYGITTVMNLRGNPEHLVWKREIAEGKLVAPNLFTAGEFVNEPRVNTPAEVEREVISQKDAGYDVIKFHEIVSADGRYVTTHGLSRPAYDAMNATARRVGMPLIGHAPDNLGLQAVLDNHQSLAHSGILVSLYFLPRASLHNRILFSLASTGVMLLLTLGLLVSAFVFWLRGLRISFSSELKTSVALSMLVLLFFTMWPIFGLLSGSMLFLLVLSMLALLIAGVSLVAWGKAFSAWKDAKRGILIRVVSILLAIASLAFAASLGYWVQIAWRVSEPNLKILAARFHEARMWVEPTLVVYQNLDLMNRNHSGELSADPAMRYVLPGIRTKWASIMESWPTLSERSMRFLFRRNLMLAQRVTGSLQQAGVSLMLGTDTFGFPFCIAGKSAHDEMRLMQKSGLSPFQVLQSATVNPAEFLGRASEFGTVTVGKRADLLLVSGNPLVDLETVRKPDGVMVRGVWLPAERLQQMLAGLDETRN